MGSVRRGLILATLPTSALAEVCDTVRPEWDGTEMTAVGEAIALFSTVPSLILVVLTALAIRFRSQWGGLVVVVLWALWTSAVALTSDEVLTAAAVEGCVGSPVAFLMTVAVICAGTVLYTLPKSTRL